MIELSYEGVGIMKDAWVLRLKTESKEDGMEGEYYFYDDCDDDTWLTQNLNDATIFDDKEKTIEWLKVYEKTMYEKYGKDAICNFGYTNITKNFEFVEVEVTEI